MTNIHIDKTGWKKYRFDEICRQVNEATKDPVADGLDHVIGLEHIEPNNLHITQWDTLEKESTFTRKFKRGQVLFGRRRAYQRKVAYAEFDGICSGDILVFEAIENVMAPELLPFLIQSDGFFQKALETSAGSLSPRTKFKELADYEFLLPPKPEQKRLAALLWSADEMIEKEKREVERFEIYRTRVCNDFFETTKSSEPIKSFGKVFTGSTPSTKILEYWNGEYPFLTPTEINNTLEPQTASRFLTIEGLKASREISKGDVLVTCVGEIGRITIASQKCCANQQINIISPDNTIDSKYLFYSLKQYKNLLLKATTISVVPILVKSSFENVQIPDFPINKKESFVKRMDDIEQQIEKCSILSEQSQMIKHKIIDIIF